MSTLVFEVKTQPDDGDAVASPVHAAVEDIAPNVGLNGKVGTGRHPAANAEDGRLVCPDADRQLVDAAQTLLGVRTCRG
jgi:hypothetical protein